MQADMKPTTQQKSSNHPEDPVKLTREQRLVYKTVMSGVSCFLTGCAGTGKSFLVNQLILDLQNKRGKERVAVTATTGIAACHIRGCTLHSFAGIGLGTDPVEALVAKVRRDDKAVARWRQALCLIIDEVSMLDADLFQKLHGVACAIRHSSLAFGGIQLLLVGDFLQLPPAGEGLRYAFEADIWKVAVRRNFELRTVIRQAGDAEFVEILNRIRVGICTPDMAARLLQTKDNDLTAGSAIRPTTLFPTNADVDHLNTRQVAALPGEPLLFTANDWGAHDSFLKTLKRSCLAPAELMLKPGAQVMLLRNLDVEGGLSNGTLGVFEGLRATDLFGRQLTKPWLTVRFETHTGVRKHDVQAQEFTMEMAGEVVAIRVQYPLKVAYALTVHKSQGLTLPKAEMALRGSFACGQVYVALSRVQSLSGLCLKDFAASAVKASPRVKEFYEELRREADGGEK